MAKHHCFVRIGRVVSKDRDAPAEPLFLMRAIINVPVGDPWSWGLKARQRYLKTYYDAMCQIVDRFNSWWRQEYRGIPLGWIRVERILAIETSPQLFLLMHGQPFDVQNCQGLKDGLTQRLNEQLESAIG